MISSNWKFHHVGIATNSLETLATRMKDVSAGQVLDFEDPAQGVRGRFLEEIVCIRLLLRWMI